MASTIPNRITETSGIEQVLNPACCIPAHKNNSIAYYRVVAIYECYETPFKCNLNDHVSSYMRYPITHT